MKTQGCCAYKSTPCHMIPTETLHFTPIRPAARDWNEFHRCGSASWQVTPPTWRRRDKDRWRKGWWRGHEGVRRGNGQRSDIKGIWAKTEDNEMEIRALRSFIYTWWSTGCWRDTDQTTDPYFTSLSKRIQFAASFTYLTDVVLILFWQVGLICLLLHNFQLVMLRVSYCIDVSETLK